MRNIRKLYALFRYRQAHWYHSRYHPLGEHSNDSPYNFSELLPFSVNFISRDPYSIYLHKTLRHESYKLRVSSALNFNILHSLK